jgi:hypothetical protein
MPPTLSVENDISAGWADERFTNSAAVLVSLEEKGKYPSASWIDHEVTEANSPVNERLLPSER